MLHLVKLFVQQGSTAHSHEELIRLRLSSHAIYCRRISLDVFTHTLDLDLNFHLHRKTGEVMRIMDRGD